jgi:predicted lactoylglutathione lyase
MLFYRRKETMTVRKVVIDHVNFFVRKLATSRDFYALALAPLGYSIVSESSTRISFGLAGMDDFVINQSQSKNHTSYAHVAFSSPNREAVDAFYANALTYGGRGNLAPAEHPEYHAGYYSASVFDPDGNNIEAVYHGNSGEEV